ncbi:MAG: enolase C-terminal domain-like protein [Pseudomonadota bacterium]
MSVQERNVSGHACTIRALKAEVLHVPFRHTFSHASATRKSTETVLVCVELEDGSVGWGESCPRSYVTGESVASVAEFTRCVQAELISEIVSVDTLRHWVNRNRGRIDRNPAAWCAIELALLDAIADSCGQSVEALLGLPSIRGKAFRYSAVLDNSRRSTFDAMLEAYLAIGIQDFKVKLSGDLEADRYKAQAIWKRAEHCRLRVDGNNLWTQSDEVIDFMSQLDSPLFGIEEPLQPGAFEGMSDIATALGCKLILDESMLKLQDLEQLRANPEYWVINLRVSKMGGLLRSIELLDMAAELQLPIIVGAQVGETSLLTRAALTAAHYARPHLVAQEGAFSTLLLQEDVFYPNLMFGRGGLLTADTMGSGFGLQYSARDCTRGDEKQ